MSPGIGVVVRAILPFVPLAAVIAFAWIQLRGRSGGARRGSRHPARDWLIYTLAMATLAGAVSLRARTHRPSTCPAAVPAAVVEADVGPAASADARAPRFDLTWLEDGSRLAVDGHWLLDPATGHMAPLDCPAEVRGVAESGRARCPMEMMSFSPDSTRVLFVGDGRIAVYPIAGEPGPTLAIPHWAGGRRGETFESGFWLSPTEVFVQQTELDRAHRTTCRVLSVPGALHAGDTLHWRTPAGGCLHGELGVVTSVVPGPHGLLAVASEALGLGRVDIVRYDTRKGQSPTGAASVWLDRTIDVTFAHDGSRVTYISPIPLRDSDQRSWLMDGLPSDSPEWMQFSNPISGETGADAHTLRFQRADLPPNTVMHPDGDSYAWRAANGSVCIGQQSHAADDARSCFTLPITEQID